MCSMKVSFEGTLAEFRQLFWDSSASSPASSSSSAQPEVETIEDPKPRTLAQTLSPSTAPPAVPANRWWYAASSTKEAPRGTPPDALTIVIDDVKRQAAWDNFCEFIKLWVQNFEVEGASQPPRLQAIQDLGSGPHTVAILVMAYELRSLQRLIQRALMTIEDERWTDLDFCNRVASHVVTLSNMGYPDIAGCLDFGTGWRK